MSDIQKVYYYSLDRDFDNQYNEFDPNNTIRFFIDDKEFLHCIKLPSKITDFDYSTNTNVRFISTFIHQFTIKDKITGMELIEFSLNSETYTEISQHLFDVGVKVSCFREAGNMDYLNGISKPIAFRDIYVKGHTNRCIMTIQLNIMPIYNGKDPLLIIKIHDQTDEPGSLIYSLSIPVISEEEAYTNFIDNLNNIIEATEDDIMRTMYDV